MLWLAVLALAFPGAIFLVVLAGGRCENGGCTNPFVPEAAAWTAGVVAAIASLWTARPRPPLLLALVLLAVPVVHAVGVLVG